jgi:cation diffusion facilitator CzcD-associated flavoprotein CzcO
MTAKQISAVPGGLTSVSPSLPDCSFRLCSPRTDPGCGVDIPGALYSLSWIPNTNFTSAFPSQSEILRYIRNVADTYKLRPHMAFRTEWKSAKWSEKSQTWSIGLKDLVTGEDFIHEAKILISAVGGVTNPKYPSLPGVDTFEGTIAHTARWNSSYNYKDKDVVVIGNGCRSRLESNTRRSMLNYH